jgi:hypothetical protein
MTLHIMFAAVLLVVMLKFRPPLPSEPLYRPRHFPAPPVPHTGAETLDEVLQIWAGADDDPGRLPMTSGEYRTIVEDAHRQTSGELDRIMDQFHAELEWLEASVMVWLDRDVETEHATVVLADYAPHPALEWAAS